MNLIMLDIDGTLTQSYEYDQEVFACAVSEVTGVSFSETDWNSYANITSSGVTPEAIYRATGRRARQEQVKEVEYVLLAHLERRYHDSPAAFSEVPGASAFIDRLKQLDNTAIAIATGCWRSEALFKLRASDVDVAGIIMATCEDGESREQIMTISAQRAMADSGVSHFDRIVYVGDGIWDLTASRLLGYGFVGVGTRCQALRDAGAKWWHEDYIELAKVLSSVTAAMNVKLLPTDS